MLVIDASSIIYGWHNYPINQFPGLWAWLSNEIQKESLSISEVALEEVGDICTECADWLIDQNIKKIYVNEQIIQTSKDIANLFALKDHKFNGSGVDENDIFIIATAKILGSGLISNEAKQAPPPKEIRNSKIPLVCSHPLVAVDCNSFLDYLKASGAVFR